MLSPATTRLLAQHLLHSARTKGFCTGNKTLGPWGYYGQLDGIAGHVPKMRPERMMHQSSANTVSRLSPNRTAAPAQKERGEQGTSLADPEQALPAHVERWRERSPELRILHRCMVLKLAGWELLPFVIHVHQLDKLLQDDV